MFLHGIGTNALLWRNVIAQVSGEHRRCIALDLPLHGHSPAGHDRDFSLPAHAGTVEALYEALGLSAIDLVANDTGGAIAQIFAAHHPGRLRTLRLTDCEAHDNVPPKAFRATVWALDPAGGGRAR
ncbi:MAG: alpha/beta fold hydrolase [Acidimicrobiales bacterium]